MNNNPIQIYRVPQSRAGDMGKKFGDIAAKIGSGVGFSTKYTIPFAAGFYVGMMDGNNIEIEPTTKCMLLTAPTAVRAGLVASIRGFTKLMGKGCTHPSLRYKAIKESGLNSMQAEEAFGKLERMANTNVTKETAKSVVKPGVMTMAGYGLGRACSSLL